jgi:hypothetical protein
MVMNTDIFPSFETEPTDMVVSTSSGYSALRGEDRR